PEQQADKPAPEAKPKSEDWEAKYRTLQGILNAEKGRWAAEKQALEERIRSLQQATAQPEPPPASAQAAVRKLITEQDKETYGPELLDLIARAAAEQADQIVQQRLAELKPEIEQAKQKVTEVTQQVYQSKEQEFYGKLAQAVPAWETVNADEGWLRWLGEPDPVFGVPRQIALDNAARALDHERVARMFNTYKQLAGIGQQAPAQPEPAPVKKPALSPTPRAVGNASAPTHREPQTGVTRSEIAEI